jgi:hypothetical protein
MRPLLTSLRRLIFGETWTIPLGVGAALALAVLIRAALPETAWQTVGGFCLAASIVAALAYSLRRAPRERP